MIAVPDDAPWWAWLVAVILFVGVPAVSGVVVAMVNRPTRRAAERAAMAATTAATELTPNSGSSAKDAIGQALTEIRAVATRQGELAQSIGGMRDDMRVDRELSGRRFDDVERRLTRVESARSDT